MCTSACFTQHRRKMSTRKHFLCPNIQLLSHKVLGPFGSQILVSPEPVHFGRLVYSCLLITLVVPYSSSSTRCSRQQTPLLPRESTYSHRFSFFPDIHVTPGQGQQLPFSLVILLYERRIFESSIAVGFGFWKYWGTLSKYVITPMKTHLYTVTVIFHYNKMQKMFFFTF